MSIILTLRKWRMTLKSYITIAKDNVCRVISRHLPRRLVYFVLIWANVQYTNNHPKKNVPSTTWDELTKWYEVK